MRLQPGQRVGSYEVLAPIGAGGMGEVFRGRDTKLDREARALTALNHPNVAQIYAVETSRRPASGGSRRRSRHGAPRLLR